MTERHPIPAARAGASRNLADETAAAGGSVFDSTREIAAQALELAADKMRDLRYGMADTASAAQRQVGRAASVTSRYVAEEPMRAALIAAAVGALVTAAVLLARRNSNRY